MNQKPLVAAGTLLGIGLGGGAEVHAGEDLCDGCHGERRVGVGVGRGSVWGLAVGGAAGLLKVLEILREELVNIMANLGCATIGDISPDRVRWSIPPEP